MAAAGRHRAGEAAGGGKAPDAPEASHQVALSPAGGLLAALLHERANEFLGVGLQDFVDLVE